MANKKPGRKVGAACGDLRRRCYSARCAHSGQHGFTLVELISVMVIAVAIAAIAAPRYFDNNPFDSHGFYDEVISTLRYAQKVAIAQNRYVCATLTPSNVSLKYGTTSACTDGNLASLKGEVPSYTVSSPSANVTLSGSSLYFDPLGKSSDVKQSISISGYSVPITVEAETGYVH